MKGRFFSGAPSRNLVVEKPLTFVDLETTGSILALDRIVEVGALKILPNGHELEFETRVNPEMEITTEALRKHGITNSDLKNAPTFTMVSTKLIEFLGDSDLAGYNILNFDPPMLQSEFQRAGIPFPITRRRVHRCDGYLRS